MHGAPARRRAIGLLMISLEDIECWLRRPLIRIVAFAALVAAAVLLRRAGLVSLLAWTEPVIPAERYPWLAACLCGAFAAVEGSPAQWHRAILTAASLAALFLLDLAFACTSLLFLAGVYAVTFAPIGRAWKLSALAAGYGAIAALCNVLWFPELLLAHPWAMRVGYLFALSYTFRLAYFHHEMRLRGFARVRLDDFLLYFILAPFSFVVPYMLAIPRFGAVAAGLARRSPAVVASGIRMLAGGLAVSVTGRLLFRAFDPRAELIAHARARDWAWLPAGVLYYPVQVTIEIVGVALVLTGLLRAFGVDVAPPFANPLASDSVLDWWRRWNTHFRQFLVDLFFYPLMLRLRRANPYAAIVAGCASVFLVGSTLFHAPKLYFTRGTHLDLNHGLLAENACFFVLVSASLCLEHRRRARGRARPPPRSILVRGLCIARTWFAVYLVVVCIGYGTGWYHREREGEEVAARIAEARARRAAGDEIGAAELLAAQVVPLRHLTRARPKDPVRRLELALALTAPGPDRDLAAAARELGLARAWLDRRDPAQRSLLADIATSQGEKWKGPSP